MPRGINEVENVVLAFIFVIHSGQQKNRQIRPDSQIPDAMITKMREVKIIRAWSGM